MNGNNGHEVIVSVHGIFHVRNSVFHFTFLFHDVLICFGIALQGRFLLRGTPEPGGFLFPGAKNQISKQYKCTSGNMHNIWSCNYWLTIYRSEIRHVPKLALLNYRPSYYGLDDARVSDGYLFYTTFRWNNTSVLKAANPISMFSLMLLFAATLSKSFQRSSFQRDIKWYSEGKHWRAIAWTYPTTVLKRHYKLHGSRSVWWCTIHGLHTLQNSTRKLSVCCNTFWLIFFCTDLIWSFTCPNRHCVGYRHCNRCFLNECEMIFTASYFWFIWLLETSLYFKLSAHIYFLESLIETSDSRMYSFHAYNSNLRKDFVSGYACDGWALYRTVSAVWPVPKKWALRNFMRPLLSGYSAHPSHFEVYPENEWLWNLS